MPLVPPSIGTIIEGLPPGSPLVVAVDLSAVHTGVSVLARTALGLLPYVVLDYGPVDTPGGSKATWRQKRQAAEAIMDFVRAWSQVAEEYDRHLVIAIEAATFGPVAFANVAELRGTFLEKLIPWLDHLDYLNEDAEDAEDPAESSFSSVVMVAVSRWRSWHSIPKTDSDRAKLEAYAAAAKLLGFEPEEGSARAKTDVIAAFLIGTLAEAAYRAKRDPALPIGKMATSLATDDKAWIK